MKPGNDGYCVIDFGAGACPMPPRTKWVFRVLVCKTREPLAPYGSFSEYCASANVAAKTVADHMSDSQLRIEGYMVERWQPKHDWEFPGINLLNRTVEQIAIEKRNDEGEWVEPRWVDAEGKEVAE